MSDKAGIFSASTEVVSTITSFQFDGIVVEKCKAVAKDEYEMIYDKLHRKFIITDGMGSHLVEGQIIWIGG